jgi:hypothetical protein
MIDLFGSFVRAFVGSTAKVYSGLGADVVMESIPLIVHPGLPTHPPISSSAPHKR